MTELLKRLFPGKAAAQASAQAALAAAMEKRGVGASSAGSTAGGAGYRYITISTRTHLVRYS